MHYGQNMTGVYSAKWTFYTVKWLLLKLLKNHIIRR